MHLKFNSRRLFLSVSLGLLTGPVVQAGTFVWNQATPGANNWNVNANWNPSTGNPSTADTAVFGSVGTAANSTTVNNVVSVNTTITSLVYTNTTSGTWHVTQIPAGVTLTVTGGVTVGGLGAVDGLITAVAMTDAGTLLVTGGNYVIGNTGANNFLNNTNDLSGLSNFIYANSSGFFNFANSNRAGGTLSLANASNSITAATLNVGTGSTSSSGTSRMNLGSGTNIINASTFNLAFGRETGFFQFLTSSGGLRLRGTAGTDDSSSTLVVCNRNTGGTGGQTTIQTTTGSVLLNDHPVNMQFATLTLGRMSRTAGGTDAGNYNAVGVFQFNQGIVIVTNLSMAEVTGNTTATNASRATGTLTVGAGGTLLAGNISLVNVGFTPDSGSLGTLDIAGGVVNCTGNITKTTAAGTGTISVNGGSLTVQGRIGSVTLPVGNLNLTNANLTIPSTAGSTNVVVTNLVTGGATNIINVTAVPAITNYPAQFPLIKYSGSIGGVGFDNNMGLGTLPAASPAYEGYISNNTATATIDLVITNGPVPAQPITWSGAQDGAWDTSTLNWLAGIFPTNYNNAGDFVTFDDLALTSTVYLVTTTLTPGSVTVNNSVQNYEFTGAGKLSGGTSLLKLGSAGLVLDNTGVNDFTGGIIAGGGTVTVSNATASLAGGLTATNGGTLILAQAGSYSGNTTINNGTVRVGNGGSTGVLPSGSVADNGSLIFDRADTLTAANVISGTGTVTKNNTGTLTLSGANSFGGGVQVNGGVLRASVATALGTGAVSVNSGATLVGVNGITNAITLSGGTLGVTSAADWFLTNNVVTISAGTTNIIQTADPQNPSTTRNINIDGILNGSGTVLVMNATNVGSPDGAQGVRFRGTTASGFSGTVIVTNNSKSELRTTQAGPFSPAGTGKFILVCGAYYGTNGLLSPTNGGYLEFNLRNQNTNSPPSGDTTFGNDIEFTGSGAVVLNALSDSTSSGPPAGAITTLGNLKIGGGQEAIGYRSGGNIYTLKFQSVTLTGGNATFTPRSPTFGPTSQTACDFTLNDIGESATSGIIMNGLRTLTLTGTSTYTGPTTVSNGTLVVSGTLNGGGAVTVAGGTLKGNGSITGSVTVNPEGTLAVGASVGKLTVSGAVTLGGTNVVEIDKTGNTNDVLQAGSIAYGGTLSVSVLSGTLAAGDSFPLFSAGSYSGSFATILPATPGANLLWDTTGLTNGTLKVVSAVLPPPQITSVAVYGTDLVLSGTNNAGGGGSYYVLTSTNIGLPRTNWDSIATQTFSGGTFVFTNAVDPATPQRFYALQLAP